MFGNSPQLDQVSQSRCQHSSWWINPRKLMVGSDHDERICANAKNCHDFVATTISAAHSENDTGTKFLRSSIRFSSWSENSNATRSIGRLEQNTGWLLSFNSSAVWYWCSVRCHLKKWKETVSAVRLHPDVVAESANNVRWSACYRDLIPPTSQQQADWWQKVIQYTVKINLLSKLVVHSRCPVHYDTSPHTLVTTTDMGWTKLCRVQSDEIDIPDAVSKCSRTEWSR